MNNPEMKKGVKKTPRIPGEGDRVQATRAVASASIAQELKSMITKKYRKLYNTIQALCTIVSIKDLHTAIHQSRVAQLACTIAHHMHFPGHIIEGVYVSGLLHDIGKIYVPSEILTKPGTLSDYEFSIIRTHPLIGFDILKLIEFPWPVARAVLQHHERINGSGTPHRLKGGEIILEAKILGVADVFEAIASHRPYRPAKGIPAAIHEIGQQKGILYEEEIVDTCIDLFQSRNFGFGTGINTSAKKEE